MPSDQPDWSVLLIGGPSGVGKTVVARQLGLRLGVPWLQVDDLRLTLQRSQVSLPRQTEALYFFQQTRHVWHLPPERLRDGLIAVGNVLSPAIEVVIENHTDTNAPIIIEGDGILPSLLARPAVRTRAVGGRVCSVFVVESDEDTLHANSLARARGIGDISEEEQRTQTRAAWMYGQWLASEAQHAAAPVMEARPWSTLAKRILAASTIR